MHNCKYCDRELKSKAGQLRHESACKARDIGGQTEEEIENLPTLEVTEPIEKVVQLEVMNGAETYYMGHPRRLTKLKGMLSATFDRNERAKIYNMILDLENEAN